MSKSTKEEGLYAPTGNETGTDFSYRKLAYSGCKVCAGLGEWHVPYEDYDTFIIHRCDCSRPPQSQAIDPDKKNIDKMSERELLSELRDCRKELYSAFQYAYGYRQHPSMRGSSLHAAWTSYKEYRGS